MEATKDLKRTDIFKINPRELYVDHEENPRKDYGDAEEWSDFKGSIKAEGVKMPITIFWDNDVEQYRVAHGFRRSKAVLELIEEGVDIQLIPCLKVKNNAEQILLDHLTMNMGKALTDFEKSETFNQLVKYGFTAKMLSEKTGMNQQKVHSLLKFSVEATQELKSKVKDKSVSITAAVDIVRAAKGNSNKQREIVANAITAASKEGKTTINVKHISNKQGKTESTYKKLSALSVELSHNDDADKTSQQVINHLLSYLNGELSHEDVIALMSK